MLGSSTKRDAYDYAERIRERLPRRMQELREACGLSMYALWRRCAGPVGRSWRCELVGRQLGTRRAQERVVLGLWQFQRIGQQGGQLFRGPALIQLDLADH